MRFIMATKSKTNDVAENLKAAFAEFVDTVMAGASSAAADAEDEEDEDEGDFEPLDRAEVEEMAIKELRALAKEREIDATKKADILAALEEGGHFADDEDEDEDAEEVDEDEDEEDEDEEGGEYDRDDLAEMSLKELRDLAKEEGYSAADVRGKDQDALIDLILGETDEDEEDEDAEDEEDDEEETEELDEDALKAMSLTELRSLAKELEITVRVPKAQKDGKTKEKKFFIETILNSGEDE